MQTCVLHKLKILQLAGKTLQMCSRYMSGKPGETRLISAKVA
jgi:hypothetical protein